MDSRAVVPAGVLDAVAGEPDDEHEEGSAGEEEDPGKTLIHAPLLPHCGV